MKKFNLFILFSFAICVISLVGCQKDGDNNKTPVIVGASATPHAEILEQVREDMDTLGYNLQIKVYDDYIQPNLALDTGELTANYFQHIRYLTSFNENRGTKLVSVAGIHYEPLAIYPGKIKTLEELKDGATISIPNDSTNEARALLLLERLGLIKVDNNAGINATIRNIVDNPKNLQIRESAAEQLVRSLSDIDMAVINGNYALSGGLRVDNDAIAVEDDNSVAKTDYVNVLAVHQGNENKPEIQALVKALHSDKVKHFIEQKYAGAIVEVF